LVDALSEEQLAMVTRHEAAHLRFGHQRSLQLATTLDHAFAFYLPLRRSTSAFRVALERCADEDAAGAEPAQRAELRAALLGASGLTGVAELAALSTVETVLERLDALEHPPSRPSRLLRGALYAPGSVFGGILAVSLGLWGSQFHMVISMAGRCPG
jgi:hypothetical protein